jgi:acetyltransferase-like isoleucine patch superfamily enzyme
MTQGEQRLSHDWYPRPLPPNVLIGEGSWVYSAFAFIHFRAMGDHAVRIGSHSGIYHGSFFDLGPNGRLDIGDYSALVGVTIAADSTVRIGSYCFLAHEVVIADAQAAVPPRPAAARRSSFPTDASPSVTIDDNAWIGASVVLLRGARIGAGAIIGARTVVDFEVPSCAIVAGNPARIVGDARRPA